MAFDRSRPLILSLAAHFIPSGDSSFEFHQLVTIRFLLDRVTSTPVNILRLVIADPVLASADVAALHRGMFEAAVNLLYLLQADRRERFQSFYLRAFGEERKMYDALAPWESDSNDFIAMYAKHQRSIADPPTDATRDALFVDLEIGDKDAVPRFPSIEQRCRAIGPVWAFFYDAKYRGLSAWQHGDATRANLASSLTMHLPETSDRTVFESLLVVIWTWDLICELTRCMASFAGQKSSEELEQLDTVCQYVAGQHMRRALEKYHFPSTPAAKAT